MMRSTQAATDRVQKLRVEYWEKVKNIDPNNLVFLDETGVLLGLARTHARSQQGTKAYDLKPFYRRAKITAIGAISIDRAYYSSLRVHWVQLSSKAPFRKR